jgi:predicted Zn-dependent peptidase
MFYPRNPLGRPIQGTDGTVGALSRRQLVRFFRSAYRPQNLLIVAAGNLTHAGLGKLTRQAFGELAPGHSANGKVSRPRHRHGLVLREKQELEQLHLLAGLPAFARSLRERYPLYVFNALLGGTMSSRLFQRIREERGLVYSVYSGVNAFVDTGFLNVYAATRPEKGAEVLELVKQELRDLRDNGPDEHEVEVAKEHLKGSLMLALESTSSRMSNLARQEIYFGRQLTLAETLRGVDRVTPRQIHALAGRLLDGQRLSLAAVGRVAGLGIREESLEL